MMDLILASVLLAFLILTPKMIATRTHSIDNFTYLDSDRNILKLIPKLELHAHLHGSIRRETLAELARFQNLDFNLDEQLDIDHCFRLFSIIHRVIATAPIVKRVFREVLADYMEENTLYLEIRTTPRTLSDGTTIEQYINLVVGIVQEHNDMHGEKMLVKLILSIDRSKRFSDAFTVANIAADDKFLMNTTEYPVRNIVGLDFSGNPQGGRFEDFSGLFLHAREKGLGVTAHTAELRELSGADTSEVDHEHNTETEAEAEAETDADSSDETSTILNFRYHHRQLTLGNVCFDPNEFVIRLVWTIFMT